MKKTNLSHTDSTSQTLTQPVVYSTSVIITSTSKQMSSDRGRVDFWKDGDLTWTVVHCANHKCENGGECVMKVDMQNGKKYANCRCLKGWEGNHCQTASVATGTPSYIIIVAVIGSMFLFLFGAVLILYFTYKRRTGNYRLKNKREKWYTSQPT